MQKDDVQCKAIRFFDGASHGLQTAASRERHLYSLRQCVILHGGECSMHRFFALSQSITVSRIHRGGCLHECYSAYLSRINDYRRY